MPAAILAAIPLMIVPTWPVHLVAGANSFLLAVASMAAITAIVATATGMFVHHTGLPTLAQAGLWGVGAYAAGVAVNELGVGFWPSLAFAALVPALVALPVAVISFRTSGVAFLVVTLAFSEFLVLVLANLEITEGRRGLAVTDVPATLGPFDLADPVARYYFACGFLAVALFVYWLVTKSRFGARLNAIRDNEPLARSLGLSPLWHRLALFELSTMVVGIAGALLLYQQRVITPELFGTLRFIDIYLAMLLGGLAVLGGPAAGAWIVTFLPLWIGFSDPNTARLAYGALLVAVMLVTPRGLLGIMTPARPRGRVAGSPAAHRPRLRPRAGEPALEIAGLRRWFGANRALDGVDLHVHAGRVHGLIGPNGSGKTTLLNCASGFLRPTAGTIMLGGIRIHRRTPEAIARAGLVRTFQQPEPLATFTPRASCELIARGSGRDVDPDEILSVCRLDPVADASVAELSHGQLRLLGVALALCRQPHVLLLDEPAAGLPPAEAQALREVIDVAVAAQTAVVVIEHDMSFLLPICDWLTVLDGGRRLADGDPRSVCEDERVIAAYLGDASAGRDFVAGTTAP